MERIVRTISISILFFSLISTSYARHHHYYNSDDSGDSGGYGAMTCHSNPMLSCYVVRHGESWESLFPDPVKRDLVMRLNRMNTHLYSHLTIAVPATNNLNFMDYSPLAKQINPPGKKTIIVSINDLAFGAYNPDGTLAMWGPVSTARGYCPDMGRGCHTSIGTFSIYQKEGSGCVSSKFPIGRGGAPMPYCMYFHSGFALHGSYEVPGYNASHGCVRMFVDDAKWLNQEFTADDYHTTVIVHE